MAAGTAQLLLLREREPHAQLEAMARRLVTGMAGFAAELGLPFWGDAAGGMFGWHFVPGPVRDFDAAARADTAMFARFFQAALARGVFLPPSPFEAAFLSVAHDDAAIDFTLEQLRAALREAVR
jgi:glutamate-1-semialdehyde 2,1-aminomutase